MMDSASKFPSSSCLYPASLPASQRMRPYMDHLLCASLGFPVSQDVYPLHLSKGQTARKG